MREFIVTAKSCWTVFFSFFQREQPLGYIFVLLGLAGWEQNTDKGTGAYGPVMAWNSGSPGGN